MASNVTAGPFIHPQADRALTAREAARLQGFRDDFVFTGSPASWYRQIGNAVPPPLARAIAEVILTQEAGYPYIGLAGRLTRELVREVDLGHREMPRMTPRTTMRAPRRSMRRREVALPLRAPVDVAAATRRLEREAALPKFMWTGKRARVLIGHEQGKSDAQLAKDMRLPTTTVSKWIRQYLDIGADGWRAYHSALDSLPVDSLTLQRLKAAVAAVREPDLREEPDAPTRPHMNRYVRELLVRFRGLSVTELKERIVARLGADPGTVYVADLLAIAHVILSDAELQSEAAS